MSPVVLACVVLAAACGNSRAPVPSLTRPAAPDGFRTLRFPSAGVSFSSPRSWPSIPQRVPMVAVVASGSAVISLWRYARVAPPPSSSALLAAARATLFGAIRARQGSVRVVGSRLTRVSGAPAIEFHAVERFGGATRQVLSTHVFAPRSEVVLEEYAPPALFRTLRYPVFAPVRHSFALLAATR
ncbi:MAG TPA: hypothetical protein VGH24_09020 [Solirubrobacteraceae bacterium]